MRLPITPASDAAPRAQATTVIDDTDPTRPARDA